jgi:hypothetical protein
VKSGGKLPRSKNPDEPHPIHSTRTV